MYMVVHFDHREIHKLCKNTHFSKSNKELKLQTVPTCVRVLTLPPTTMTNTLVHSVLRRLNSTSVYSPRESVLYVLLAWSYAQPPLPTAGLEQIY